MAYQSRTSDACSEIKDAQLAVKATMQRYRSGGGLEAVNTATKRLNDAHQALYRVSAGLALDDR